MKTIAWTVGLLTVVTTPAFAEMITVYPPSVAGELSHEEILEALYPGNFTLGGLDYTGGGPTGSISAVRYDDFLAGNGILDAVTGELGSAADQVWTNGALTLTAEARYAAYSQQLGIDRGAGFEYLFDVSGYGTNVTGGATIDLLGETWRWVRRDSDGSNAFYSEMELNRDELDHMATYRIHGLDTEGAIWLLFWEDLCGCYGMGSDRDFNDLVVEVRAVPGPATLVMFVAGGLALVRRVKKVRR